MEKTENKHSYPQGAKSLLPPNPINLMASVQVNQCVVRQVNGVKKLIVIINFFANSPTVYNIEYSSVDSGTQAAFDAVVSWASNASGGSFPTPLPDPVDDYDPVIDDCIVQIVNKQKNILAYRPWNYDAYPTDYTLLDTPTKSAYDTLCNWADSVDSRFL